MGQKWGEVNRSWAWKTGAVGVFCLSERVDGGSPNGSTTCPLRPVAEPKSG
jgi:hypothetical protein